MEPEKLTIDIGTEDFWANYCILKSHCNFPLPIDFVQYSCYCDEKLAILKNGDFFVETNIISIPDLIEELKSLAIQEHFVNGKCTMCKLTIDPAVGVPEVFIFGFNHAIHPDVLQSFTFEDIEYKPILCIYSKEQVPVMAIFLKSDSDDCTYSNIIKTNFESHLNVLLPSVEEKQEEPSSFDEDKVSDDETASQHQHQLPRMSGGGRKMMQEFKYICQWCSEETLKQKTRGRFMELKNYRDHFRRVHQDVPFTEFLNKVDRDEPKFHCKICNKKISLGNQLRHQIICRPPHYQKDTSSSDSSSEADVDMTKSLASKKLYVTSGHRKHAQKKDELPNERIKKRAMISSTDESDSSDRAQAPIKENATQTDKQVTFSGVRSELFDERASGSTQTQSSRPNLNVQADGGVASTSRSVIGELRPFFESQSKDKEEIEDAVKTLSSRNIQIRSFTEVDEAENLRPERVEETNVAGDTPMQIEDTGPIMGDLDNVPSSSTSCNVSMGEDQLNKWWQGSLTKNYALIIAG